ncbi:MAG: hypothetical protein IJS88_00770 [Alphaproteobacteria bacterium]|nr:hypothetical protein [Alphaproteobacteria bacterium]
MNFDINTFDFLISEENEVMLILYARDIAPEDPIVRLNPENNTIELYRMKNDAFTLEKVDNEVFELLKNEKNLLVCEILPTENPDETEIVYTYEAIIIK